MRHPYLTPPNFSHWIQAPSNIVHFFLFSTVNLLPSTYVVFPATLWAMPAYSFQGEHFYIFFICYIKGMIHQ